MANGRRSGGRQMKHWHGSTNSVVNFTADATGILATFSAPTDPYTILRTLGQVIVVPTGSGTFVAADLATVTCGLGIVSSDALAAGAGSLPDPAVEPEYDWLWWHPTFAAFEGSADAPGQEIGMTERINFDTRAMRKVKPRQALVMVAQYQDSNGAPPLTVSASFRVLSGT